MQDLSIITRTSPRVCFYRFHPKIINGQMNSSGYHSYIGPSRWGTVIRQWVICVLCVVSLSIQFGALIFYTIQCNSRVIQLLVVHSIRLRFVFNPFVSFNSLHLCYKYHVSFFTQFICAFGNPRRTLRVYHQMAKTVTNVCLD